MTSLKRFFTSVCLLLCFLAAMADWSYGSATFRSDQPSNGMSIGTVQVWYDGTLTQSYISGGVEYWECTGNICVVYPANYSGPKLHFSSSNGTVQIQTLR